MYCLRTFGQRCIHMCLCKCVAYQLELFQKNIFASSQYAQKTYSIGGPTNMQEIMALENVEMLKYGFAILVLQETTRKADLVNYFNLINP